MNVNPVLLRSADTVLVGVDLQSNLLKAIHDSGRVVANAGLLLRSAAILGVPSIATTQNAPKLGAVDASLAEILEANAVSVIDKMTFSAARSADFIRALESTGRKQVVLCGVETHICVTQTALDLVASGYQVHIAVDAVSSRTMEKHKLGMERLRDGGALPIASEAVVYELLVEAGTPSFKSILPLVKG